MSVPFPPVHDPLLVIGAGAAGLIASWRAASLGAGVLLLERNRKPGIKILISGGGKCNITHAGEMERLRAAFLPRERRFLNHAFHRFTNGDLLRLIEDGGVPTVTRPDGLVFPASGRAEDVVRVFTKLLEKSGVVLRTGARVDHLHIADGAVTGVTCDGAMIPASQIVLATGGVSYPKTGATGDGFAWAAAAGHTIIPLRPALAPIAVDPPLPVSWRGVAVRGGCLHLFDRGRKTAEWRGDVLFTHEGISGPAALEVSRAAALALEKGEAELRLDVFPARDHPALDAALSAQVLAHRGKTISSVLEAWLPNRIVPHLLALAQVDPGRRGHVLTRAERRAVTGVLKSWTLGRVAGVPIERGEVTAGGVSLDEVDPRTMRSRIVQGLTLCGELLDIAGPVGGYNLQAAFSTGYVAGETAARDWLLVKHTNSNREGAETQRE